MLTIGAFIIGVGVPLKGSLGVKKGSIVGFYHTGALIIGVWFWGPIILYT